MHMYVYISIFMFKSASVHINLYIFMYHITYIHIYDIHIEHTYINIYTYTPIYMHFTSLLHVNTFDINTGHT